MTCEHLNFQVKAKATRCPKEDGGPVTDYYLDVEVFCTECKLPFKFKTKKHGLSPHEPMASASGLELRCPIEPDDGTLKLPSKSPGYFIQQGSAEGRWP